MADSDTVFAGSIADVCGNHLLPLIFEADARGMARRGASAAPPAVVETSAGSGVVSRGLAPILDNAARSVATDAGRVMPDGARRRHPADARIRRRQADPPSLHCEDGTVDVCRCRFGAMSCPDRVTGYRPARRVSRGGGRPIICAPDRIERNACAASVTHIVARLFPDDPQGFPAHSAYGYRDPTKIEAEPPQAGVARVEIHVIAHTGWAPKATVLALAHGRGRAHRSQRARRDPSRRGEVTRAAAADIERRFGSGPVWGRIRGHVVIAATQVV